MISFETRGSGEDAEAVCEAVRLVVHATSLSAPKTTMERRARYAYERAVDTPETLIRLSVGLEHLDDLWRDLDRALRTCDQADRRSRSTRSAAGSGSRTCSGVPATIGSAEDPRDRRDSERTPCPSRRTSTTSV